jgi:hypothetical protein
MIDPTIHAQWFALLCERFGRAPTPTLHDAYLQSLNPHLDTDQFVIACRRVFHEDTWFPSPLRIVDASHGKLEDAAARHWLELWASITEDRRADLDDLARGALKALGGTSGVRVSLERGRDLVKIRELFVSEYIRAGTEARASSHLRLPAVSGEVPSAILPVSEGYDA